MVTLFAKESVVRSESGTNKRLLQTRLSSAHLLILK